MRVLPFLLWLLASPLCSQEPASSLGRISLPDKTWGVIVDLSGFTVRTSEIKPDGRRYMFAENSATGVSFSIFLEEADPQKKNKSCRENQQVRLKEPAPYSRKNARIYESGEMVILEFLVPEFQGAPVQQQNLWACTFRDNTYIDIHLSKVRFQPDDERLFQAILQSFRIQEGIQRTSRDYLEFGSLFYAGHNYKRAIGPYQTALEMEKKNPTLEKTLWRVLVDNLGMAYGITGDLEKSREVFEYGLSRDSTYPLFYYNMACYYGEKGDAANAGVYLKKAFEYKANLIPGEKMPDPRADDSFKKLLKDQNFRRLVESLVAGS